MKRNTRTVLFLIAAALLAWSFWLAYRPLAGVGYGRSEYGDLVNAISVPERHITDAVTAVNFDVRGFDTLGEEFILFASVMGTLLLMRRQSDDPAGDHEDKAPDRDVPPASDAVRVTSLLLVAPTVLFGIYIVTHGQVSPGGGFQGGVILASAPLLVYLCAEYYALRDIMPKRLVEISEAIGAAGY
ncbi:MAG: MnhB domain-containing protein, partial [Terriglobales bacterium]